MISSKLASMFYENVDKAPKKLAVWCDGKTVTYEELAELVSKFSNLFALKGVRHGDHIAVIMDNSIELIAILFSAAELGACVIPLNPSLPFTALKKAIYFCDTNHIIAKKSFYVECNKNGDIDISGFSFCCDGIYTNTISLSSFMEMSSKRPINDYDVCGDESLILTMTSGSTGNPKPIDVSQNNKIERSMSLVDLYGLTEDDCILATTPLYHSLSERLAILSLIIGSSFVLLSNFAPDLWVDCVGKTNPTFTIETSNQLTQIMEFIKQEDIQKINCFKGIVSSSSLLGELAKKDLIEYFKDAFHEIYGSSELSGISDICYYLVSPDKRSSLGKPLDGVQVRVLRDDNSTDYDTECESYEIGEIACKTEFLCKGYYKQNSMMQAATIDGFFRTGDLGYLDDEGYLYFVGRKKEAIVNGATNVFPNDIDVVVERIPEVEECAAFAYPDDKLGEVVALAIVPKEECEINVRSVKTYCANNLADFQQPHKVFIVDKLPRNTMGKIQRNSILNYIKSIGLD